MKLNSNILHRSLIIVSTKEKPSCITDRTSQNVVKTEGPQVVIPFIDFNTVGWSL